MASPTSNGAALLTPIGDCVTGVANALIAKANFRTGQPLGLNSAGTALELASALSTGITPAIGFAPRDVKVGEYCIPLRTGHVLNVLDTDAGTYNVNDRLYLSVTAGAITNVAPTTPDIVQVVGMVTGGASSDLDVSFTITDPGA